jgi:hypothetical protein
MSSTTSLTLPALLTRTLTSLLPIFTDQISTSLPAAQQTLPAALADLALARRMIDTLGIFSTNESMEDVADGEMVFMAVDWVVGEVQGRVNGDGLRGRIEVLERSQVSRERSEAGIGKVLYPNHVVCAGSVRSLPMAPGDLRIPSARRANIQPDDFSVTSRSRGTEGRQDQAVQDGKGAQGEINGAVYLRAVEEPRAHSCNRQQRASMSLHLHYQQSSP